MKPTLNSFKTQKLNVLLLICLLNLLQLRFGQKNTQKEDLEVVRFYKVLNLGKTFIPFKCPQFFLLFCFAIAFS